VSFDQLGCLHPVHDWHADIHDDDIRVGFVGHLDCCPAIGRLAYDLQIWLPFEDVPQRLANERVIVH
jgi:hypothetical protein